MRGGLLIGLAALAACVAMAGCGADHYARQLIEQNTSYGKINEAMMGSSKQLVDQGAISTARNYAMPDGTKIDVWILKALPKSTPKGTVLVLHGLCDSKVTYLRLARMLGESGFDVVLPDLRAHGRSTGKYVTYGALEKHDMRRVMDALRTEQVVAGPVLAFGVDLGGAVAIQYAALDEDARGVMALAAPKDLPSFARRFMSNLAPFMDDADFQKTLARAGEIGDFDPTQASALDAMASLRCPVMLVHGKLDTTVPYSDSEDLVKAAAGPVELESIPWVGHIGMLFGREQNIVDGLIRLTAGQVGKGAPRTQPAQP